MTMSDSSDFEADTFHSPEADMYHDPETVTPTSDDGVETDTIQNTQASTAPKQTVNAAIYFPPERSNSESDRDEREVCFDGAIRIVVPAENTEISADVFGARKVEVKGGVGLAGGAKGLAQILQTSGFSEILRASLNFIFLTFWANPKKLKTVQATPQAHTLTLPNPTQLALRIKVNSSLSFL